MQIFSRGRLAATLSGSDAVKFMAKTVGADAPALQMLMAKATGHFKQGNERVSRRRRDD